MFLVKFFVISISTIFVSSSNLIQLKNGNSIILSNLKHSVNPDSLAAIEALIHKALTNSYQTLYITTSVQNKRNGYFLDILSELLKINNRYYAHNLDSAETINPKPQKLRQNSILLIENIEGFHAILKSIIPERFRLNGNFLFVLVNGYFGELEEIYETLWKRNIFNAFAIYEQYGEIILNTFLPYENSRSCGSTKPKFLAKFYNGKFETKTGRLFIGKLLNLQKCPIRIVVHDDPTFVSIHRFKNGTINLEGRGMTFINTLAAVLNFTNDFTITEGEMPWGLIFENGTITGNLLSLHRNNADIALGEYYMKSIRNKYFDPSLTHYTTNMVFIIPPGRPYRPAEKLLQPFDFYVWIVLLITIMIAFLVILIVNYKFKYLKSFLYGRGVQTPALNILLALFGLQQTIMPGRNFSRFLLMMFLILCLVLRNIYQGSLFQFLQSNMRHQEVQSINEMIEKDFTFYVYDSALDIIKNQTEILARTKLFNKSRNFFFDISLNGDEKIAGLDSVITIRAEIENGSHIRYLKEPLMTFNIVLYFRKHFYLQDEINTKIDWLISTGIMDYWMRNETKHFGYISRKRKHPRRLNIQDLKGTFNIVLAGYGIGLSVFFLELLIKLFKTKKVKNKNVLRKNFMNLV